MISVSFLIKQVRIPIKSPLFSFFAEVCMKKDRQKIGKNRKYGLLVMFTVFFSYGTITNQ